ncbi:S41 family peptidase [Marinifilum caeruleilacunae]|uniref:Tail specific protease domain-containing protein n=1 Tax=Marinifilum caeruleilacunae TaxID=2499076 RepID=A0ABX1WR46_9BACT|nr:S41 family peptidase [Marinifilum caeruleilacunae]NOU58557.1 hypothetical protein [Marinifilum caeruleilacunae]
MKNLLPIILLFFLFNSCEKSHTESEGIELMFDQVWQDFDRTYSYFELKGVDWDACYDKYRPMVVNGETSLDELEKIIANMSLELKDLHVRFYAGDHRYQYNNDDQFTRNSPENAGKYLSKLIYSNKNIAFGEIQNSDYAYLRFFNLSNNGNFDYLNNILSKLNDYQALVLDIRDNSGGNDNIAKQFVNRLSVEERVFEYCRFRNGPNHDDFQAWQERKLVPNNPIGFTRPIIVLTNRFVVSSAEAFTAMMSVLPNVTIVGDTTRGATGNPKEFSLSNGWKYYISSWQAVTADYEYIEDKGIAPDFAVTNTQQSIEEGKDLILEKAIELLNN